MVLRSVLVAVFGCQSDQVDAGPTEWRSVAASGRTACGITVEREVRCWGFDGHGLISGVPEGTFTDVRLGTNRACASRSDGTLACWGERATDPPEGPFVEFGVGAGVCALDAAGAVDCWENAQFGETEPPGPLHGLTVGQSQACALAEDDDFVCWGLNGFRDPQPPPNGRYARLSAGANQVCALGFDGVPHCWGSDQHLDLGTEPVADAVTNGADACALALDGALKCVGTTVGVASVGPLDLVVVDSLAVGDAFACGVDAEGRVQCDGDNTFGQCDVPE